MRHHPLTPMTDANLVRVLQRADHASGRPDRPHGRRRRAAPRRSAPASMRCAPTASASPSSTPSPTTTCCASARRSRGCRWSPPARAWRSVCRELGARALRRRRGSCRRRAATGPSSRVGARWPRTRQVREFLRSGQPAFSVDPLRAGGRRGRGRRRRWPSPRRTWTTGRCSSTPPSARRGHAAVQAGSAPPRPASWSSARWPRVARGLVERGVAPARRRRRRDLGRGRAGARRHRAAHRPADRPRRAVVRGGPARRGHAPHHAQVGQLRRPRLLHLRVRPPGEEAG